MLSKSEQEVLDSLPKPAVMGEQWDLRLLTFQGYTEIEVFGGKRTVTREVPPAGEDYAFDRVDWSERIVVTVSPKGRRLRLFRNGKELI